MKKEDNHLTKYEYELPEEIQRKDHSFLHISVRDLVEFVLRSGDIDDRTAKGSTLKAMQEGSRIHRKLQKQGSSKYHAEVPVKFAIDCDDYVLGIEGRADGLIFEGSEITRESSVLVDEIKGVYQDLDDLKEPVEVHLAQAKCYAYIIAEQNHLEAVDVQITYCNLDTEEVRRFCDTYTYDHLHQWFYDLVQKYRRWSDFSYYFRITRQNSISALDFPFDFRTGQKELVQNVYLSIHRNKLLFVQAPTGTGKTVSTIFPAVKAVGENEAERIFYLTAKTVTRAVARDTFHLFEEKGYRAKTVVITAKDKLCPLEERKCNPKDCPYARGHFDRINDAVYDLLQNQDIFDASDIASWAQKRMVCPFELNLDISSWCDNIICDYNYVFDPNVYLKRFFSEGISCEGIFLIDEAHNLVERGREMYSETLVKEDFLAMKKPFKVYQGGIVRNLDKCNRLMLEWKRRMEGDYLMISDISSFLLTLSNVVSALDRFFEKRIELEEREEILDFYFKVRNFLDLSEGMDERYCVYSDLDGEGHFCLHLFCMDPSYLLQQRLDKGNAAVFFSATLLPVNYYKNLLCMDENPYAVYASSVFDPKQRGLFIGRDVTTRYKNRGADQYKRYASYICEITSKRQGNYLVFFPSYRFLNEVLAVYQEVYASNETILVQSSGMKEEERREFLDSFSEDGQTTLLGFCVLGGVFSEGIDLTNDRLIGAIVVGTGLPQISNRRKILSDHFDRTSGDGFLYSYLYPGMNKVMQAAGRVIRTVFDTGIIVLLDERFLYTDYKNTFPREWKDYSVETIETIGESVEKFWENRKK